MAKRSRVLCTGCGKRIFDHEPDLMLGEFLGGGFGEARYFHTRCGEAARQQAAQPGAVHRLTVRHIDGKSN